MVAPHDLHQALGADAATQVAIYRELFQHGLEPGLVDQIRAATNGNLALRDSRFASQVAEVLGAAGDAGQGGAAEEAYGFLGA